MFPFGHAPADILMLHIWLCCQPSSWRACRRKRYDQTGSLEDAEELSSQSFEDLFSFYRDLYKQVTPQDIEDYAATYRGSAEETADLVQLYERHKGDMRKVRTPMRLWQAGTSHVQLKKWHLHVGSSLQATSLY